MVWPSVRSRIRRQGCSIAAAPLLCRSSAGYQEVGLFRGEPSIHPNAFVIEMDETTPAAQRSWKLASALLPSALHVV